MLDASALGIGNPGIYSNLLVFVAHQFVCTCHKGLDACMGLEAQDHERNPKELYHFGKFSVLGNISS